MVDYAAQRICDWMGAGSVRPYGKTLRIPYIEPRNFSVAFTPTMKRELTCAMGPIRASNVGRTS